MVRMPVTQILAVLAGLGLLVSIALVPLRMGWGRSGMAQPASGGWWILSLVTVTFWALALSSSLKAHAKTTTSLALKELKVVSAADILKEPEAWRNVPVVINDLAYCAEVMADPDARDALATRVHMRGEDEVEGEENDYIDDKIDYGTEEDAVKFTLGTPNGKLRADDEGFTILPAGPAVTKVVDTGEFSAVKGSNLMDTEVRRTIPCGAKVFVSGVVTLSGEFVVLDNLPKHLSILTDRPWGDIVATAANKAKGDTRAFWGFGFLAATLAFFQLAGAVRARARG
jgi:hypothetical protein